MKAKVVFTADFEADLAAQTRYLIATNRRDWALRLMDEIETVAETLSTHPELGVVEIAEIRKLVLPKIPLVLRYAWDVRAKKVIVLRLFHARQKRKG